MEFICDKKLLADTINSVSLAVSTKSTLISLEGVLMKCSDQQLTLTGYNLELGIVKTIPVQTKQQGEIVLNASLLSNIVNKMPSGEIYFISDQKLLTTIRCNDAEFTILGLSADDYPEIPSIDNEQSLVIPQDIFKNMISQTLFAVAQSEQTPVYTGTLFDVEPNQLSVISVDGYRLAMRKETLATEDTCRFVVPGKTLNEIQKLLTKLDSSEAEQNISVHVSSKHIIFEIGGYRIFSRLLEGDFLDYKNAIPKEHKTSVILNTREFMESINRASIIINDRAKSPIKCDFSNTAIQLSCETALGKVNDTIEVEMEGENVRIGFNHKYMTDALKASESDKILIRMNGPLSPMKILPLEGDHFLFLVLPVRMKD